MERARDASGRYIKMERAAELVEEWDGTSAGDLKKAPRPNRCSAYTRARFAEALPELMHVLLREAKKGSVAHMKLLVVICGLNQGETKPEKAKRAEKTLEQILLEDWKRDEQREQAEAGTGAAGFEAEDGEGGLGSNGRSEW